jgi:signal transduction histidine kinase/GNAT superfamily N-acetyltransferase
LRLNARRILRDGERTELILLAIEDHTELARLEQAAQQHVAQLVEDNRHKMVFLALLGHELRNPLTPIRNALHVLERVGSPDESAQRMRAMIERQVQQLTRLVDDLLDMARITRGRIEVRKQRLQLGPLVDGVVEVARMACESKGIALTAALPVQPLWVDADATRLAQAIGNVLNNACKFTDAGGRIELTVERDGEQAVIRVRDSGIGIAADQLPRVFDMFMQIETSVSRSHGGLGIGLSLVKQLIEAHGGAVSAHSDGVGHGSEFELRLPLRATETRSLRGRSGDTLSPRKQGEGVKPSDAQTPSSRRGSPFHSFGHPSDLIVHLALEFREITAADAPALLHVRTRTRENTYTLEQLERLGITAESVAGKLASSYKGWLCAHSDRIVGFCIADCSTGELWVIAVLPEYEGQGVGNRLMALTEEWLWASGCTRAWLTTDVDTQASRLWLLSPAWLD